MEGTRVFETKDVDSRIRLELQYVTIAVVTILAEEFAAAISVLNCKQEVVGNSGRTYRLGVVRRRINGGSHIVAVTRFHDMGNNSAASGATQLLTDCVGVKDVIVCGIAGAVPHPQRLGDIVVTGPEGVLQYDLIKRSSFRVQNRSRPRPPSRRISAAEQALRVEECLGNRIWETYIEDALAQLPPEWVRPPAETDILCEPPKGKVLRPLFNLAGRIAKGLGGKLDCPVTPHPNDPDRREGKPMVFRGVIASSNTLLKDPVVRERLREEYGARAVEMEGSGVADATYEQDKGYFVVRSTCDYCNDQKNDMWHFYAALAAAAYTKSIIERTTPAYFGDSRTDATQRVKDTINLELLMGSVSAAESAAPIAAAERLLDEHDATNQVQLGENPDARTASSLNSMSVARFSSTSSIDAVIESMDPASVTGSTTSGLARDRLEIAMAETSRNVGEENHPDTSQPADTQDIPRQVSYKEVLLQHIDNLSSSLESNLRTWEYSQAFQEAAELEHLLDDHRADIPPILIRASYVLLARAESTRAGQLSGGGPLSLAKAKTFLEKAKNA
jgi:nucleoside phosphorylase